MAADERPDDGVEVVTCDVSGACVDLELVDALARMHLIARRLGCRTRVGGASDELRSLVELVGLSGVLVLSDEGTGSGGEGG